MLDTRYFRSNLTDVAEDQFDANFGPYVPNKPGEGTFLGAAQWKWLEEELKKKADVRIVMSSVQVIPTAHGWEKCVSPWPTLALLQQQCAALLRAWQGV